MQESQRFRTFSINDLTAIARPVDPSFPTNRAIAILSVVVMAGSVLLRLLAGSGFLQSLTWGISVAFSVFLAWALGRELDPDHDLSAFAAAGLALVGTLIFDLPNIMTLLWILLLMRILNRTIGLPAKVLDSLSILGLAAWLTIQQGWVYGVVTTAAFLLDSLLSSAQRRHLLFAAFALMITVVSLGRNNGSFSTANLSQAATLIIVGFSFLFLVVPLTTRVLKSVGDRTGQPLNPQRVQSAQLLFLSASILIVLPAGDAGLISALPLWATISAVALYRALMVVTGSLSGSS
jgi:hypothetical protein